MKYDHNNVFAKIIRKEITAKIIYEDDYTLAFEDANPVAPVHTLVVPKGNYIDYNDFITNATSLEISNFFKAITIITNNLNLSSFRLITNKGEISGQSVYHFHMHIISGKQLGGLIASE